VGRRRRTPGQLEAEAFQINEFWSGEQGLNEQKLKPEQVDWWRNCQYRPDKAKRNLHRFPEHSKMPIPDYQSLMLPVLRLMQDGKEHSVSEMRQRIAEQFNLTEEELSERLASDTTTVFMNRVGWAVQYLKSAVRSGRCGEGCTRSLTEVFIC
jgi:hypothetical protein